MNHRILRKTTALAACCGAALFLTACPSEYAKSQGKAAYLKAHDHALEEGRDELSARILGNNAMEQAVRTAENEERNRASAEAAQQAAWEAQGREGCSIQHAISAIQQHNQAAAAGGTPMPACTTPHAH